jgi:hypothetical protein
MAVCPFSSRDAGQEIFNEMVQNLQIETAI